MTENAYVFQKAQIGVESTPGTAVAATKRFQGTSFDDEMQVTSQDFTPEGSKYVTIVAEQKEWSQLAVKGYPGFGDMVYLFSSLINTSATVTKFMDSSTPTGVYKWTFDSDPNNPDTPKTYTIEKGSSVRAHRYANCIMREFGLKFTRASAEVSGQFIGQRIQDGVTLTSGVTAIELSPMLASGYDLFIDATFGGLGTTKIGRLFSGDWKLGARYGAVWPVDSSQTSFAATVETKPTATFSVIVAADSAGLAYINTMRASGTVFARIRNIGLTLYSAGVYVSTPLTQQFTLDSAIKIQNITRFSDQEGVYAVQIEFMIVNDSGWTKAFHAEIQNQTAAL